MEIIENEFIEHLKEAFDEPSQETLPEVISLDMGLEELDGWDSLTRLSFAMIIEEEYDVELEKCDFSVCDTVQDLMNIIQGKM